MAKPLNIKFLRDLRSLGEPPTFDGTDAEYQDFRLSIRIHMSLVSPVWQQMLDKCEIETNPISLQAVKALGRRVRELQYSDLLLAGSDHEGQRENPCPLCGRNQRSSGMGVS